MTWRRGSAIAVAGLALMAGACRTTSGGGEVQTATPAELNQDYLAQVADASTAARTGRFDMTVDLGLDATASGAHGNAKASGAFDADAGTYQQRMTVEALGEEMDLEIIGTRDATYQRGSILDMFDLPEGTWIRLSLAGATANPVGSTTTGDPAAMLDTLRAAGAVIEDEGTEVIGGVQTRHVRTTATLNDVGNRLSDGQRDNLSKAMQGVPGARSIEALLDVPIGLDVYIDGDNRVRRLVVEIDLTGLDGTTGSSARTPMRETIDYHDYGAAVNIVVPSEADTVDGFELLRTLATAPGTIPHR